MILLYFIKFIWKYRLKVWLLKDKWQIKMFWTCIKCWYVYFKALLCKSKQDCCSANKAIPRQLQGSSCLFKKAQHAFVTELSCSKLAVESSTSTVSSLSSANLKKENVALQLFLKRYREILNKECKDTSLLCQCNSSWQDLEVPVHQLFQVWSLWLTTELLSESQWTLLQNTRCMMIKVFCVLGFCYKQKNYMWLLTSYRRYIVLKQVQK